MLFVLENSNLMMKRSYDIVFIHIIFSADQAVTLVLYLVPLFPSHITSVYFDVSFTNQNLQLCPIMDGDIQELNIAIIRLLHSNLTGYTNLD